MKVEELLEEIKIFRKKIEGKYRNIVVARNYYEALITILASIGELEVNKHMTIIRVLEDEVETTKCYVDQIEIKQNTMIIFCRNRAYKYPLDPGLVDQLEKCLEHVGPWTLVSCRTILATLATLAINLPVIEGEIKRVIRERLELVDKLVKTIEGMMKK